MPSEVIRCRPASQRRIFEDRHSFIHSFRLFL